MLTQPSIDRPNRARSVADKDRVRQALLASGRALMARPGTEPVSLRSVARHAGYTPGLIYRYFPDRDALFLAIRELEMGDFIDRLESEMAGEADVEHRLRMIADHAFDFARSQIDAFGMNSLALSWLDRAENPPLHDLGPSAARIHAFFESAIELLLDASGAQSVALDVAVASFMAAVTGSILLPGGSAHRNFPANRRVMHAMISALMAAWRDVEPTDPVLR